MSRARGPHSPMVVSSPLTSRIVDDAVILVEVSPKPGHLRCEVAGARHDPEAVVREASDGHVGHHPAALVAPLGVDDVADRFGDVVRTDALEEPSAPLLQLSHVIYYELADVEATAERYGRVLGLTESSFVARNPFWVSFAGIQLRSVHLSRSLASAAKIKQVPADMVMLIISERGGSSIEARGTQVFSRNRAVAMTAPLDAHLYQSIELAEDFLIETNWGDGPARGDGEQGPPHSPRALLTAGLRSDLRPRCPVLSHLPFCLEPAYRPVDVAAAGAGGSL